MQTAKALSVSIVAAAIAVTLPSRAFVASSSLPSDAGRPIAVSDRGVSPLEHLGASVPAPEPRDFMLLVMSLAAIVLTGRSSK